MSDDQNKKPVTTETGRFRALSDDVSHELKGVLAGFADDLKRDMSEERKGLQQLWREHADRNMSAHAGTRRQVVHLTKMTSTLWRDVRGDEPPPPPAHDPDDTDIAFAEAARQPYKAAPSSRTATAAVHTGAEERLHKQKLSDHDLELAAKEGRILALESQVTELLKLQKEQMGKKDPDDERGVLTRLADGIAWTIREREGQKFLATLIAGATGLITALGTTYALMTGRLPMPASGPAPTPPALHTHSGEP